MFDNIDTSLTREVRLLAIAGSILLLLFIVDLIRKERLKEGYSLLWFLTAFILLVFSVFSNFLFSLSQFIGIYYAPATLFLLLIISLLLISVHFSTVISRHEKRIKELSQENALLQNEILKRNQK